MKPGETCFVACVSHRRYVALLGAVTGLILADSLTTVYLAGLGSPLISEANPLMSSLLALGPNAFLFIKMLTVVLVGAGLGGTYAFGGRLPAIRVVYVLIPIMLFIVANNLALVLVFAF